MLAVVVQNQEPSSRWYSGSGITRHVHLTVANPLHIARWGTTVTTPDLATTIASHFATVHVATQLANDSGQADTVDMRYVVRDAPAVRWRDASDRGVAVPTGGTTSSADHPPRTTRTCGPPPARTSTPSRPQSGPGAELDSASRHLRVRWLVFKPDPGVMLNGQPLKLHGVDLHNDEGALGSVDNYDAMYRQMSNLKAMGSTRSAPRTTRPRPSSSISVSGWAS